MEAQQSFAGLRESFYSGVIQTTANPAYMISSKRPWDANLFLVNFDLANNAIKILVVMLITLYLIIALMLN